MLKQGPLGQKGTWFRYCRPSRAKQAPLGRRKSRGVSGSSSLPGSHPERGRQRRPAAATCDRPGGEPMRGGAHFSTVHPRPPEARALDRTAAQWQIIHFRWR
eukprot:5477702-Pyramimonas_sp.AAC.1